MKGHWRIVILTMGLLSTSILMFFNIINKEPILGFYIYWNWKEVSIKNDDTLKIPQKWKYFSEDNKFFSAEVRMKGLYGYGFPNSADMLKVVMKDDEGEKEGYVLSFPTKEHEEEYYFIVWDSEIGEKRWEKWKRNNKTECTLEF